MLSPFEPLHQGYPSKISPLKRSLARTAFLHASRSARVIGNSTIPLTHSLVRVGFLGLSRCPRVTFELYPPGAPTCSDRFLLGEDK